MDPTPFKLDEAIDGPTVSSMHALAKEVSMVIPTNIFEQANKASYNTNAVIDANGDILGLSRKSHISPGGPGCHKEVCSNQEDTYLLAFKTACCRIGTSVCRDPWFPEAAPIVALKGAEVLFFRHLLDQISISIGKRLFADTPRHMTCHWFAQTGPALKQEHLGK